MTQKDTLALYSERIRAIEQQMVTMNTLMQAVNNLSHVMFGNGTPGIPEQVRDVDADVQILSVKMDTFMTENKTNRDAHRAERNQYRFLTYAAFLSLIANVVLQIVGGK